MPLETKPAAEVNARMLRRSFLSVAAAIAAERVLVACNGSSQASGGSAGGAGVSSTDAGATGVDASGSSSSCVTADADAAAIDAGAWASGGTAAMTGKASYPNPFAGGCNTPSACTVSCELTEGPCYSDQSVEIQDISYGYAGLPMRLYFQVLDESCKPVSGAVVDVWHVSPVGKYSGDDATNEDISFCTGNDSDFTSHLYFRGKQTTDANGIVYFDTCYPGWYSSRTVHIHLTISVGSSAYVTTQLCFPDELDDAIIASQPLYDTRGSRDTKNTTDTVFSASDYGDYEFSVQRMNDGAMLAWKSVLLRSSLSESICGGSSGDGGSSGGGGPPGGDGGMMGAPGEGGAGGPGAPGGP